MSNFDSQAKLLIARKQMLLTKTSENAIKMMFYLMDQNPDEFIRIRSMAADLGLPYYQTAKIAQSLIRSEILNSYTGPNGGIQLNKDSRKIFLIDIIVLLEGVNFLNKCVLGLSECGSENPCAVHHLWKDVKEPIIDLFENQSLHEIKKQNLLKGQIS